MLLHLCGSFGLSDWYTISEAVKLLSLMLGMLPTCEGMLDGRELTRLSNCFQSLLPREYKPFWSAMQAQVNNTSQVFSAFQRSSNSLQGMRDFESSPSSSSVETLSTAISRRSDAIEDYFQAWEAATATALVAGEVSACLIWHSECSPVHSLQPSGRLLKRCSLQA